MKKVIASLTILAALALSALAQTPTTTTTGTPAALTQTTAAPTAAPPPGNVMVLTNDVITSVPGTIFGTALAWFTSQNPLLVNAFQKTHEVDIFTGTASSQGAGMTAEFGGSYNLWNFAATNSQAMGLQIDGTLRNGAVGGVLVSEQAGFGLFKTIGDLRISGGIDGGYDSVNKTPFCAPYLRVQHALSENTGAYVGGEVPLFQKNGSNTPRLCIGLYLNF